MAPKSRKRTRTYGSIHDIEREYLPNHFEKKMHGKPTDPQALGTSMARESLDKMKSKLKKK